MSNHPPSPMLRLVSFALGLIILAMFVSPILVTAGNYLGQAAAFLEETSSLYAEAGGPEPDWPRPAYAGLRLPDLALLQEAGDEASPASAAAQMPPSPAPVFDVQASGVELTGGEEAAPRAPGLAAVGPSFPALRAAWQATVTPTVTATLEIATSTPTATPTETETPPPEPSPEPTGEAVTATLTATPSPTLEATPVVTPGTETPAATETATPTPTAAGTPAPPAATPTATLTPAPAVTPTATFTPSPSPTFTPTSTPMLIIDKLSLEVIPEPATVLPGQAVTVTLRLANAGPSALPALGPQAQVNEVTLSAFLPPALQYQASLGEPSPGYDPRLRMLVWQIGTLVPDAALELGYRAQVAPEASPGALTLSAEAGAAGLEEPLQASGVISVEQPVEPTPTSEFEPPLPGPPARIQLAAEPVRDEKREDQPPGEGQSPGGSQPRPYWLAVYVVDAGGLAVADGTQVQLGVTGGEAAQTTLRTRGGIATTRLDVPPGQVVTVTARAGEASGSLAIGEETGEQGAAQVGPAGDRYGARARALVAARNAFSRDGAGLAAENRTRRITLEGPNLDFTLKGQQAGDESLALSFQLTGVTPSPTLPLSGGDPHPDSLPL